VGYSDSSKAYKVYIPSHQRIETSRDVTFDEDTIFNRSRQRHTNEVHDEDPAAPGIANVEGGVDRLFSTGVNSCIMKYYLCRRQLWFYWVSDTPTLKFL
jgi:hypothetical protein